jgi:hypothetical protein
MRQRRVLEHLHVEAAPLAKTELKRAADLALAARIGNAGVALPSLERA